MTPETLLCNHCGASLQVPPSVRFATCQKCGARLSVVREGGAVYTQDAGQEMLDVMHQRLEHLETEQELSRLDREWELERDSYMITGRYGQRHLPTQGGAVLGGVIIAVFGVFWTAMAASITGWQDEHFPGGGGGLISAIFPLFGILFIFVGVGMSIHSYNKAGAYRHAEAAYRQRRQAVLDRKAGKEPGPSSPEPPDERYYTS